MAGKPAPASEGEELESFLGELERDARVREIAGLESGFANLSRALNGISPGLHLLIGPSACGKTAFARQLCDQAAFHNPVAAMFFSFAEKKNELRIRTLARLSGLENREIHRGSGFLLHWYGSPKRQNPSLEEMPLGWEKVRRTAEEAKGWLDRVYLFEANERTDLREIARQARIIKEVKKSAQVMVVIDDSQRLGASDLSIDNRLFPVTEGLHALAADLQAPVLATWPDLRRETERCSPQEWAERVADAEVILVMEEDRERSKKLTQPNRAIRLHIAKNRGGERGALPFDFMPAFSRFIEVDGSAT